MEYVTSRQLRKRLGDCSDMTLWRMLHNEELGFPKPVYIQKRRYWRVEDLDAFDRRIAAGTTVPEAA